MKERRYEKFHILNLKKLQKVCHYSSKSFKKQVHKTVDISVKKFSLMIDPNLFQNVNFNTAVGVAQSTDIDHSAEAPGQRILII